MQGRIPKRIGYGNHTDISAILVTGYPPSPPTHTQPIRNNPNPAAAFEQTTCSYNRPPFLTAYKKKTIAPVYTSMAKNPVQLNTNRNSGSKLTVGSSCIVLIYRSVNCVLLGKH